MIHIFHPSMSCFQHYLYMEHYVKSGKNRKCNGLKFNTNYSFQIQWWYVSGKTSITIGLQFGKGISHDKYHVEETSNTSDITVSTLTVRSVHSEDEGMYRCVIRIPRIAYPAWPKENGFIYIQGMIINCQCTGISQSVLIS